MYKPNTYLGRIARLKSDPDRAPDDPDLLEALRDYNAARLFESARAANGEHAITGAQRRTAIEILTEASDVA